MDSKRKSETNLPEISTQRRDSEAEPLEDIDVEEENQTGDVRFVSLPKLILSERGFTCLVRLVFLFQF
jgi:hypothetical protein